MFSLGGVARAPPMSLPSLSPPHQDIMHFDMAGSVKVMTHTGA